MVLRFCLFVDAQYNQLNDLVLISCMKASIRDFYQSTEVPEIEDVLELKRVAPPLQTKPMGRIDSYFGENTLVGFY